MTFSPILAWLDGPTFSDEVAEHRAAAKAAREQHSLKATTHGSMSETGGGNPPSPPVEISDLWLPVNAAPAFWWVKPLALALIVSAAVGWITVRAIERAAYDLARDTLNVEDF